MSSTAPTVLMAPSMKASSRDARPSATARNRVKAATTDVAQAGSVRARDAAKLSSEGRAEPDPIDDGDERKDLRHPGDDEKGS